MAPILPGLSDKPELLAEVVREARAAGATGIWANLLYLRPGTREHFLAALERDWPELLPRYERLYRRGAYLPRRETDPVRERVRSLARSTASATGGDCASNPLASRTAANRGYVTADRRSMICRPWRHPRSPA